jgi:NAD(P)-dependent dehydrogenase (short-subunit alcohol dehydrogenase family)
MADAAADRDERTVRMPAESAGTAPGRGRLTGRRVLVVGAGQNDFGLDDPPIGNGRAMALLFAREGAAVAVADRDRTSMDETVRRIVEAGGTAVSVATDVAEPDSVAAMVTTTVDRLHGLDGVVYNVGIGEGFGLAGTTVDSWDRVFAVNLRGAMLTARAALPVLDPGASIVFISSVASVKPGSRIPSYDSSKAAMAGLMRHVAVEGERRAIRANVVAPGLMDTSLGRWASQGRPSRARTPVPLGRQGTGWETAYAALFLLSDEAAYITGQVLRVDGGLTTLR